ncbi:unnamed protein product [Caenorhabditis brenneri]
MNLLSKLFFNSQSRDEKNERTYIIKGYPLTNSPVIPDILKHQVEFRTINDNYGLPILGLTLAHEGADLVEPECLEVIRKRMFSWFKHHSEPAKYFEKELPRNLIAISFAQTNFQMAPLAIANQYFQKMLSRLRREIEKDKLRLQARQGYPITRTPYTPPILDSVVGTKTLKEYDAMLKLFLAKDGSDLVKTKSLEFIRQRLMIYFTNYPTTHQVLKESPLPSNTIAVTFTRHNFDVGDTCTEFIPTEGEWESGYFTYQRLSENCQVTYLNLDGQQYCAGICYYPVLHGMPKMSKLNKKLIAQAVRSDQMYPSEDRTCGYRYNKYKDYGRYCETAAKHVVVNFAGEKRGVCHQEIDYTKKDAYKFTRCEECAEEKETYKYVRPAKVATVTPPPAPKVEKPAQKELAPEEQSPSDDAEILSLLKSYKIGLPELKTMITTFLKSSPTQASEPVVSGTDEDIQSTTSTESRLFEHVQIPQPSKLSTQGDLRKTLYSGGSVEDLNVQLEKLDAMLDEMKELQRRLKLDTVSDKETFMPDQNFRLLEPLVADIDIPLKGPEEVRPFTPTEPLLETETVLEHSRVEPIVVFPEDDSLDDKVPDEDTQSTTSAEPVPPFLAPNPFLSEFPSFSEKELKKFRKELLEELDEELEVGISSASSTESLVDEFEKVEEAITDIDSDIDIEIVD